MLIYLDKARQCNAMGHVGILEINLFLKQYSTDEAAVQLSVRNLCIIFLIQRCIGALLQTSN